MRFLTLSLVLAVAACSTPNTPERAEKTTKKSVIPFKLDPGGDAFSGPVTDVLPAGSYTYLRVNDTWVVSLKKELAVGDVVNVKPFGVAEQFESKKLGRSFDVLHFSVVTKEQ
jgi:hypothetical protein